MGKSTFCAAATRNLEEMAHFQGSLTPLEGWDAGMVASWARCLGTEWGHAAAAVLESHGVHGKDLHGLVARASGDEQQVVGDHLPSAALEKMTHHTMSATHQRKFAQASESHVSRR